jgi:glycosyltransferase involved in cell wall biosynthesis
MNKYSISIVIPAYNDAATIRQVIEESLAAARSITGDYEICVIDDGSQDATWQILEGLLGTCRQLVCFRHSRNEGYGKTIKELFSRASKDLIFSCPGDGQIPPSEVLKMMEYIDDIDVIIGRRTTRLDNLKRNIQTKAYNFLIRAMYGLNIYDINSVKLYRRALLQDVPLECKTPFIDAELCIRAFYAKKKIREVPISHRSRLHKGASGGKLKIILPTFIDLVLQQPRLKKFRKAGYR